MSVATAVALAFDAATTISGLWQAPREAKACLALAHGAGAGMGHPSMAALADGLADRGIATLRYNFPFMERGSRRPDAPAVAQAAVRAAVTDLHARAPALPLFAGGRSFGGRMTSQAQAHAPLGVRGLVFFAFPLHPAGKPGTERAQHLAAVEAPMLFLQGSNDAFAQRELLGQVVASLGDRATLVEAQGADHSFHAPARSGRKDSEILAGLLDAARDWMLSRAP